DEPQAGGEALYVTDVHGRRPLDATDAELRHSAWVAVGLEVVEHAPAERDAGPLLEARGGGVGIEEQGVPAVGEAFGQQDGGEVRPGIHGVVVAGGDRRVVAHDGLPRRGAGDHEHEDVVRIDPGWQDDLGLDEGGLDLDGPDVDDPVEDAHEAPPVRGGG